MTETSAPTWLNAEFLEHSLRSRLQCKDTKIIKHNIKPAVKVGENYFSQIFRIKLTVEENEKTRDFSIIVKAMPHGEKVQEWLRELEIFRQEADMLKTMIPNMIRILPESLRTTKLSAKCLFYDQSPTEILIMEDLCEIGYIVKDRRASLDLEHTIVVVQSLAVYHAGMHAYTEQNPELKEKYKNGIWGATNKNHITKFLQGAIKVFAQEVNKWTNYPKKYGQRLLEIQDSFQDKCYALWEIDNSCPVNSLLHGDCWLNNILFKYQNGKVDECVFVDFQLVAYNSVVLDLHYFIFSSIQPEIRTKYLDFILNTYYIKFMSTLKQMNINMELTFKQLKEEFIKKLAFTRDSVRVELVRMAADF